MDKSPIEKKEIQIDLLRSARQKARHAAQDYGINSTEARYWEASANIADINLRLEKYPAYSATDRELINSLIDLSELCGGAGDMLLKAAARLIETTQPTELP